jgi:hypothetical protein
MTEHIAEIDEIGERDQLIEFWANAATVHLYRAKALEARLAAVEALCDEWQRHALPGMTEWNYAADVRAAMSTPTGGEQ